MSLELPANTIHLWHTVLDEITDQTLLTNYQTILNDEEKIRWQKFRFAKHQHQYLVAHVLLRSVLSRYIDIAPQSWQFTSNQYGRPEISNSMQLPLRFNLSHTDGLVMCAVVLTADIGVDVENTQKRQTLSTDIAKHCFSKYEIEQLYTLPESQQPQRFLEYWTLKEAYIKAKGMGLSLPLDQFSFMFTKNQPIAIKFAPELRDQPACWQFWQVYPSAHHIAAIAVKSAENTGFELISKKTVPLIDT